MTEETKVKHKRAVQFQLTYHGTPVAFQFAAAEEVRIDEIEQMIDTLQKRDGWGAVATTPAANGAKKPTPTMEPTYGAGGEALCPVHHKALKEGDYGLYCSAKAKDGEAANGKGYCAIRFR